MHYEDIICTAYLSRTWFHKLFQASDNTADF